MRPNRGEDPRSYRQQQTESAQGPPNQQRQQGQQQPGQPSQSPPVQQPPGQNPQAPPAQGQGQPPAQQAPGQNPQTAPVQNQGQAPVQGAYVQGQSRQQWHQPPAAGQPAQAMNPAGGQQGEQAGQPAGARPSGRPRLRSADVEEIIQTDVVTVRPDAPVTELVAAMADNDVGSVVVVGQESEPVGVVTDRAVAISLAESPDASERTAEELVTGSVVTGTTQMTVFEVLEQLRDEQIRRLPIVDEEGSLQGIVTLDDLLVVLGHGIGNAIEIVEAQSPRL